MIIKKVSVGLETRILVYNLSHSSPYLFHVMRLISTLKNILITTHHIEIPLDKSRTAEITYSYCSCAFYNSQGYENVTYLHEG